MITRENWTYARYSGPQSLAFVSLGAKPQADSTEVEFQYFMTLADDDYREIFQNSFIELDQALEAINKTYGKWPLLLQGEKKSGDGCSSCHAH
jgi:hypothetical protein